MWIYGNRQAPRCTAGPQEDEVAQTENSPPRSGLPFQAVLSLPSPSSSQAGWLGPRLLATGGESGPLQPSVLTRKFWPSFSTLLPFLPAEMTVTRLT